MTVDMRPANPGIPSPSSSVVDVDRRVAWTGGRGRARPRLASSDGPGLGLGQLPPLRELAVSNREPHPGPAVTRSSRAGAEAERRERRFALVLHVGEVRRAGKAAIELLSRLAGPQPELLGLLDNGVLGEVGRRRHVVAGVERGDPAADDLLVCLLRRRPIRAAAATEQQRKRADDGRSPHLMPAASRSSLRRSSAPRPAPTARAARDSLSSSPLRSAYSSSSWRSSASRAVFRNSQPNRTIVRMLPSIIMIVPAMPWSLSGEIPQLASPGR